MPTDPSPKGQELLSRMQAIKGDDFPRSQHEAFDVLTEAMVAARTRQITQHEFTAINKEADRVLLEGRMKLLKMKQQDLW
jgi:hypothetical protein